MGFFDKTFLLPVLIWFFLYLFSAILIVCSLIYEKYIAIPFEVILFFAITLLPFTKYGKLVMREMKAKAKETPLCCQHPDSCLCSYSYSKNNLLFISSNEEFNNYSNSPTIEVIYREDAIDNPSSDEIYFEKNKLLK